MNDSMGIALEYDKIDISERIDVSKTNLSKECGIFHYWYFLGAGFKYDAKIYPL